jgi:hypothetical protein
MVSIRDRVLELQAGTRLGSRINHGVSVFTDVANQAEGQFVQRYPLSWLSSVVPCIWIFRYLHRLLGISYRRLSPVMRCPQLNSVYCSVPIFALSFLQICLWFTATFLETSAHVRTSWLID